MSRYLITGGAGFIGSNAARHFLAKGHHVTVSEWSMAVVLKLTVALTTCRRSGG